ncbi:MAG: hypothetical protein UU85_C0001G0124 [Candidatus Wolfebacteria bacterium GW2011_GWA2_42_10]|uniref:Uncharacterized protein n=2 Tax=Candidatus Wolfeibacteriota TaxID=1752735 RepID=A0A0G0XLE1_9BACT|nr:MAG: hypothetical protein UU85_C0001G0124 [Candidatus Wolfebacteria bacterium GW2011_GWA2_42_10]
MNGESNQFKKWFWVGMAMGFFNLAAGLVYGIVLALEKEHRQEGLIIIGWTIAWTLIGFFLIGPWLVKSGYMPRFQMINREEMMGGGMMGY